MDNQETSTTMGTQDTRRTQTKQNTQHRKQKCKQHRSHQKTGGEKYDTSKFNGRWIYIYPRVYSRLITNKD